MSGLFDDEDKTPARGRKHKASEAAVETLDEALDDFTENDRIALVVEHSEEKFAQRAQEAATQEPLEAGHPFEASIKAAQAIADDNHLTRPEAAGKAALVNRLPISDERRARILNYLWENTRFKTGHIEWRELRNLLKEVVEML